MNHRIEDYRPLGKRVWVEEAETARTTRAGLYLVDRVQPDVEEGIVRRVGTRGGGAVWMNDGVEVNELEVWDGERVVIPARLGQRYDEGDRHYRMVDVEDVMAETIPAPAGAEQELTERMVRVLGKWVLVEWEEAKDTILGGRLLRGHVGKKAHFTGRVLMRGPKAVEIEVGERYFFEQFSDFRSWQEGEKRFALVPHEAVYCEIPQRTDEVCLADSEVASNEFEKCATRMMA